MKSRYLTNVIDAFIAGAVAKHRHDRTDGQAYYYRDNKIAWRDEKGAYWFNIRGWPTMTTALRLRMIGAKNGGGWQFYSNWSHRKLTVGNTEAEPYEDYPWPAKEDRDMRWFYDRQAYYSWAEL